MSAQAIGLAGVVLLVALVFARIPVAIALALVGALGYAAIDGAHTALTVLGKVPFELAQAYSLSVLPLFIMMGVVASKANMSNELFRAANAVFSGFRGALASATIGACAAFGCISGSSLATAATMARVAVPEMTRHGYHLPIAAGAVASGGTLGILIPPSVILVIYALIAEESIGRLFAAALVPGILLAALHVLVIVVLGRVRPDWLPKVPAMPLAERLRAGIGMWKLLLLFFLAVFGIYLGWFSPTEAAAVASFAAIVIAFATRAIGVRQFLDALLETVYTSAMLFFIVIGAFIFSRFVVLTQLPAEIAGWAQGSGLGVVPIMIVIVALYVVLGMFLESVSMVLITVPVLLPLMHALGFDAVWFGIFVTVLAEVGLITPPVGLNVFVIRSQVPDISLGAVFRGVVPFLAADAVLVALLVGAPAIALWLPARLGL
ncbi:MAG: TRAP transporter large permease [Burkholderiales bacterium]|nr:TRAP transporter large permease [Burkholderiales bacterium]